MDKHLKILQKIYNRHLEGNPHAVGARHCLRCRSGRCMLIFENRPSKIIFFSANKFFMNFGSKNGCPNEFKDGHEKSCS